MRASSRQEGWLSEHEREDKEAQRLKRRRRVGQDPGHGRASARLRLPLQSRYRRTADRRRGGSYLAAVNWTEGDYGAEGQRSGQEGGELLAERAKAAGVESVCVDRGGYKYTGVSGARRRRP